MLQNAGGLEKQTLERRLKYSASGFADSKRPADFGLSGTMHLNLSPFASGEQVTHSTPSQYRRVTVPAEMTEHDALDFSRQKLFQNGGGGDV